MKKRIAFVTDSMTVGGVEKALIEFLNYIDYDSYEVVLWVRQLGKAFDGLVNANVQIACWGNGNSKEELIFLIRRGKLFSFIQGLWFRLMLRVCAKDWVTNEIITTKARAGLDDNEYDCVIAFQGLQPSVMGTALYRLNSPRKIAWIHGSDAYEEVQIKKATKEYLKFDHIFCVSNSTKDAFCNKFAGTNKKTSVFYNLLNEPDIKSQSEQFTEHRVTHPAFVTVGRLHELKGQQMVPRTTRLLLNAGYDIHWYLVGDGPLRETVEAEIQKYDVADHVILLGTQMNPYPYIKNCDIYVQPSFSEGYCTTTMEAKILRKPIVTTDAPGMREQFISGENGLIVDAMTPEALFDGIKTLLDHPELREKFVENLSHETCNNSGELQKLYDFIES